MTRRSWLAAIVLGLLVQAAGGADWEQWRGPGRAGLSPDVGLLKDWNARQPKLLWTASGLGSGYASVSMADGRIYTTGNLADGQAVVCVERRTAKSPGRRRSPKSAQRTSQTALGARPASTASGCMRSPPAARSSA